MEMIEATKNHTKTLKKRVEGSFKNNVATAKERVSAFSNAHAELYGLIGTSREELRRVYRQCKERYDNLLPHRMHNEIEVVVPSPSFF